MQTNLPDFLYHPDPVKTGVIEASDKVCICCQQARGYIYTGSVSGELDMDDPLCPWCIADGSANEKFDASFTDELGVGGYGQWEPVSKEIIEIIANKTPSFISWQSEQWWTHCGDAAVFIDVVGYEELKLYGEEAITAIAEESVHEGKELDEYIKSLSKDYGPTAYLFKCRHCGKYGGYSDCH